MWHVNCCLKKIFFKVIYGNRVKFGKNVQFRKRFNLAIENEGKVVIGDNTFFNNDCSINAMNEIEIGNNCLFGENVKIYDHNHVFKYKNVLIKNQGFKVGAIHIGNNCWLCSNVIILKDVQIGDNSVVGAGKLVKKNIEDNEVFCDDESGTILYEKK